MFFYLLLSVLASLLILINGQTSAPFSLCYIIDGLASGTLDDPFSIAVRLDGTYDVNVQTSVAGKYTPAGQYVNLLSITGGLRQTYTRNGVLVQVPVTGLAALNSQYFNDNRLYVSNSSQWVDADGINYLLDTTNGLTEFPGKIYSNLVNLYRTNVYGAAYESETSGIRSNTETLTVYGIPSWTGTVFDPTGGCDQNSNFAGIQYIPLSGLQLTASVSYHLQSTASEPAFTIDFAGSFTSTTFLQDSFGDYYSVITAASGTRTYCYLGSCVVSTVNGIGPIGDFGFADNQIYGYAPYFTYDGLSYTLSTPVAKPGYALTSVNTTSHVNIYFSKGGIFLEAFGTGGSGPNSTYLTSATSVSVTLSQ